MKICPICNFENFHRGQICERCKCSIWYIKEESFHIDQFIVKNTDIYVIISVLIALSAFLYDPSLFNQPSSTVISSQFSSIITIPLFFSIYLLFKLVQKAWKFVDLNEEHVSQTLIETYLFSFLQLLLIFGLLLILDKTNNIGGFCIIGGLVGTAEFVSGTKEKGLIAEIIAISSIFTLILGIVLFLSLKTIYSIIHLDWLIVYLFSYCIFIIFLSVGELIGAGIYFLLKLHVNSKDKESLLNFRKKYLIYDVNTNHLKYLWVIIVVLFLIGIILFAIQHLP